MERWTHEEFCEFYQAVDAPPQERFADWLELGVRSVRRWLTEPDSRPGVAASCQLDKKLREAALDRVRWLPAEQVNRMHRRDLLKLLSAGAMASAGGMGVAWGATPTRVSAALLDGLEETTTALAVRYGAAPPQALLGAVMGHLEEVVGLLRGAAMQPFQRVGLESVAADVAIFVGSLSMQAGKFAQADAHFGLAERVARQAGGKALVAQALAKQAMLHYYALPPAQANDDPRPRVALLTEAERLAARHAAPIVAMTISGWLAEDKAAVGDAYGADQAIERSWRALERVRAGDAAKGFCSVNGQYNGDGEGTLLGSQGVVELSLGRDSAVDTLRASLSLRPNPRRHCLEELAMALIACGQPEEASVCLRTAHTEAVGRGSSTALHHVLRARTCMPPQWSSLSCVRALDEQLRQAT
ncbi:MAG: hypothetical protein ACRD0K_09800 [Egibacteraceae bacterium]